MKICLLVNAGGKIKEWQYHALIECFRDGHNISLVVECDNTVIAKRNLKNTLYFVLALISRIRVKVLRNVPYKDLLGPDSATLRFTAKSVGAWQEIPEGIILKMNECDVVVKFGMGLLKVPDRSNFSASILSYHHGDPSKYRGRPAGFYEILDAEDVCGIIVQEINNVLDGGQILSLGYSRIEHDSYSATLRNLYMSGIPLLRKALSRPIIASGTEEKFLGENYRLPNNFKVIRFLYSLLHRRSVNVFRKLFYLKNWQISKVKLAFNNLNSVNLNMSKIVTQPENVRFLADPIAINESIFLCEGLVSSSELGEIFSNKDGEFRLLDLGIKGHKSYPFTFSQGNKTYLLPEMSQISNQCIFSINLITLEIEDSFELVGLEDLRLIDPTLLEFNGKTYLFAGNKETGNNILRLYISDSISTRFTEHPESPIVIDPRLARMGGGIVNQNGILYRVGQDCSRKYGDGIGISLITGLSPTEYEEKLEKVIKFEHTKGPHTLSISEPEVLFDHYQEVFAPFKVVNFIRAKIKNTFSAT